MTTRQTSFWLSPKGLAALALIGAASYFLLIEHRQHLYDYLPYLILLACVFMHMFMHGGHGGHDGHDNHDGHGSETEHDAYQRGLKDGRNENNHRHH